MNIQTGNIQAGENVNIAEGDIVITEALEEAIHDNPGVKGLVDELERAIEQPEPNEITVKQAFKRLFAASKEVAEVAWAAWKNPLTGLGLAWEKLTGADDENQ